MITLQQFQALVTHYGVEALCAELKPFITDNRLARIETVIANRLANLHVALECPGDLLNASAVKRSAEALGVDQIHVIQADSDQRYPRGILQGSGRWVESYRHKTLNEFLQQIPAGTQIAGASPHAEHTLDDIPIDQPLCILLGNETNGLSDDALTICDIKYKIPMYGMTESFNLSVSSALSLHALTKRIRQQQVPTYQLSSEQTLLKRALYYCRSANPRIVHQFVTQLSS